MKDSMHDIEKSRYEYRAKNTLAIFFPDEFGGLEKSERPDWIDSANNIGVEVVRVLNNECIEERKSFSKKLAGKSKSTLSEKEKAQLSKYEGSIYTARELGISNSDVIISHCCTTFCDVDMVWRAINRKRDLLQSYSNFNRYYLYVLCDAGIGMAEIKEVFDLCHKEQQKSKKRYCGVFIDDGEKLYRHDFFDGTTSERALLEVAQEVFIRTEKEIKNA